MEAEYLTEQQEKILDSIGHKRWTKLDDYWKEANTGDPLPIEFHKPIIDKLLRKQEPTHFVKLYEPYLQQQIDLENGEHVLELTEYVVTHDGRQDWVRENLVLAIELVYGEDFGEALEDFIRRAGLNDEAVPVNQAMVRFNDLLGARVGQVFSHRTWGRGVVKSLDMREGKAVIDFELKPNQEMTLDGVRNFLQRIPPDHIHAQIALHRDEVKHRCKKEAASVVRDVLKSFGGRLKAADMKRTLTTRFLTESEYKSFWEKAKKAIKIDQWIDQKGTGVNSELFLRTEPRTFFDDIFQNLVTARNAVARRDVLRDVRRHGSDAEMTDQDVEALYALFKKPVDDGVLKTDSDKFAHGLLFLEFKDLFEEKENPIDLPALFQSPNVTEFIRELDVPDSRRLALEQLIGYHPDKWAEMFAEVTISLDARTAAWMEKEMLQRDRDHERQIALESIVAKPDANPELFVWAAKNLLEGNWKALGESLPPTMICEELLSLLAELSEDFESPDKAKAAQAKSAGAKVRAVLSDGNCKFFKKAVAISTVEEGRRVLQTVRLHDAISHQLKGTFERILVDKHEDLRTVSRIDEEEERRKPAFHYATREAVDAKRAEMSRLVSTEIPETSKRIETARELGDLRENAEYHAAKDHQKMLMQRVADLEDLLARARVVEAKDVKAESTRFGTRVTLRNTADMEVRTWAILGMWEADPDNGIISYLTPFGSQLLGRTTGEVFIVDAQDGTKTEYEVLGIELAFEPAGEGR